MGDLCAISIADFCFRFSRYNIRIAFNRNGSVCLGKFAIFPGTCHRTFHNAVFIIDVLIIRIDLVLIQTAKGKLPDVFTALNGNIVQRVVSRVFYRFPIFIICAAFQAALELDVNLARLVLKFLILCISPELVELNVDQCAPGVGKDCGNWGGICLLNLAFHHGVVVDHMGGMAISRNGYALQSGTIVVFDFLDGIAGANGDAGDGSGVIGIFAHFDLNILYDVPIFQTLTANIIKGNFELVGSGQFFALCGLLLDCQPAGFDGVDVFYL